MTSNHELQNLEKSVENAGTQLNSVATKLNAVEQSLMNYSTSLSSLTASALGGSGTSSGDNDGDNGELLLDDVCVMELLESMTEVKNEYQNLCKDIKEVQQLQKEMTMTLRYQLRAMQQTFNLLKKRIEVKATQN